MGTRIHLAGFLLTAIALATAGCSSGDSPPDDGPKQLTIVMIPKGTTASFWKGVETGAKQAAKELNVNLIWKGPSKENDRALQKQLVQQFTNDGVDGILLAATDHVALVPEVRTAMQKGIPVLIFDSALDGEPGKDYISLVATDNLVAGRLGGQHLMDIVGAKGKVVVLRNMEGHDSTLKREEGAIAVLKEEGANILLDNRFAGESVGDAQNTALNLMDTIEQADGIFASNQIASEGLLLALRQKNMLGKIHYVGFDSSPLLTGALKDGDIDALVVQDPVRMGYLSVKSMVDHLAGKPVEPRIETGCHVVTRENMNEPEIKKLVQE
jgi:ribose transport system substrate-binding protein